MLVRQVNMEGPSESVLSGSAMFLLALWQATTVWNFRTFAVIEI